MGFTRRVLGWISWLQHRKILVMGLIVGLEILIGLADYVVSDDVPITALHYITIALATVMFGRIGAVIVSIEATISFYISSYVALGQSLENLAVPGVGLTFLIFLAVSAGVILILRLLESLQNTNAALSEKLALLQASRAQVELLTSERERLRLARELHDGVAKTLLGVEYSATALSRLVPASNSQALDKIRFIEKVCRDEVRQLREIILDLRQGYKTPLFELLTTYLERWQVAFNIEVHSNLTGTDNGLQPAVVYELMAIVEEGLENVQRHSEADRVKFEVSITDHITVRISDDGVGLSDQLLQYYQTPDIKPRAGTSLAQPFRSEDGRLHFGLNGMIERAEWLGGTLRLERATEGGLLVELIAPIKLGIEPDRLEA